MWWLCVDPDDTRHVAGEAVDLDWFVDSDRAQLRLDREYPLRKGDELWIYERAFRRVSGRAHVVEVPYRSRSRWWMGLQVDQDATRALREHPLRCEDVVMRREPWRYGEADPWLLDMHHGDVTLVRAHLAALAQGGGA